MRNEVYMGPYLKCENRYVTCYREAKTCETGNCKEYLTERNAGMKYCPSCGEQRSIAKIPFQALNVNHIVFDNEALACHHSAGMLEFLIPNVRRHNPEYHIGRVGEHTGVYYLTQAQVELDTAWFTQAFAPEIASLREAYGPDKVSVHWGVVVGCH